ncbi:uncharacterized protein TRAVEDRAFT_46325 [Trametes versicolor FP-101664 SS1]|uniref:uncharacterized protein n=1 Tax=Trametes versicolor (strain FP-101664) TaxID=717944 RepID=UPI0004622ACF|nr:uncharacterized protein TRAVEDRAFT_46325 [Trametes versicolor FP-101664 SS1]EIW61102.1 hypothetical protein TRAVEDRAFT_46325 [Trametes versicolor FP-101664 SS1]
MSADPDAAAEAIELAQSIFVNNFCGDVALTLLFFEYATTLDREVNLFWKRKFTGATTLFLTNRYIPLLLHAVDMCGYAPMSDKYVPWAAFSGLRAYALSGPSIILGLTTFLLSSVAIAVNLTQYHWLIGFNDPTYGLTIVSRTCMIAADVLVIIITWAATYRMRGLRLNGGIGRTLSAVLFEYGIIYFLFLTILNALHLSFTLVSLASDSISPVSYVTVFTEPITAVLISRFLFELQEANADVTASDAHNDVSSRTTSLNFARVVGTLGSPLVSQDERLARPAMDSETYELEDAGKTVRTVE